MGGTASEEVDGKNDHKDTSDSCHNDQDDDSYDATRQAGATTSDNSWSMGVSKVSLLTLGAHAQRGLQ